MTIEVRAPSFNRYATQLAWRAFRTSLCAEDGEIAPR